MTNKINIQTFYLFNILYFSILPIGFLVRVFYSRVLSIEDFGFIYSLISFFGFCSLFANMGLSASLKHFIPKYIVQKKHKNIRNLFWYTFTTNFVIVFFISIIIFLSSNFLAISYFHNASIRPYILIFLIYFISMNLLASLFDVFLSYQLNIHYLLIRFLELSLLLLLSVTIYSFGSSYLGLKFAFIYGFSSFIAFIVYFILIFKKFPYLKKKPTIDNKLLKKHFNYSFYIMLSNLGFVILSNVDSLMITYFLSTNHTGIYSNIFAIVNIIVNIFAAVSIILMPVFSQKQEEKDYAFLTNILNVLYNLVIYLIIPFCLVFAFFSDLVLKILYGSNYVAGKEILFIFAIFVIFKLIYTYNLNFMNGLGYAKYISNIVLYAAVLNLILNLILIKLYELEGVAVATVISWIVLSILTSNIIFKKLKFQFSIIKIIKIIFSAIVFSLVLLLTKNVIFIKNYYVNSFIILLFSFTVYYILGYLIKIYTIRDLYIFIPVQKIQIKFKKLHEKYFPFLK